MDATLWVNSKAALGDIAAKRDITKLAEEISETVFAALDANLSKNTRRDISEYSGQKLSAAIASAIQASLKIRTAA
jgi:hypothetical protein